jgi:hypothetical protein
MGAACVAQLPEAKRCRLTLPLSLPLLAAVLVVSVSVDCHSGGKATPASARGSPA